MFYSKSNNSGRSPNYSRQSREVINLVANAIRSNLIEIHFQPIVRTDCAHMAAFYECLVRIKTSSETTIPAGAFLPIIEDTALMTTLDEKVLLLACKKLKQSSDIRLSVNISLHTLESTAWLNALSEQPQSVRDRLIIEITESVAILDINTVFNFLNAVRKLGCSIAIDDFGAGYTSFRYLRDLNYDIVKIDGCFIQDLSNNLDNQIMLKALIDVCQHFEVFTVAEYVETPEDAKILADIGVDCIQGYLIGRADSEPNLPTDWLNHPMHLATSA